MCRLLITTVALLLILFGTSSLWMMPKLIHQKIEQRLQLKMNTKIYDRFTKIPIPLTVKIYFFNISNSEQVLEGKERPKFIEVGPFVFKQWRRRDVIDMEDYNRKLRYREYKTFYTMYPSASKLSTTKSNNSNEDHEDTKLDPRKVNLTIINLPLLAVLTTLAKMEESSLKRKIASKITRRLIEDGQDKILMTRPANELLFDGTNVKFLDSTKDLISQVLGFNFESPLPENKFGFFHKKNNTWNRNESGELTIFTGRNGSMNDFMIIDNWNDLKELSVWPKNTIAGNRCNQIRGTDGSQFYPGVRRDQILSLFSPLVCTSLHIVYKEDTQARDIPLLRFITPADLFAAPKKNARNACYCTIQDNQKATTATATTTTTTTTLTATKKTIDDSRCYLDGLMDLSLCQKGAPVAASSPHFLNADPMLAIAAGLKPNKDIHQTYLDIEPMTGSVFRAASRAQINAYVERAALDVIDSSVIGSMTPMVAPIFWMEELGGIDEKSSIEFKGQLLNLVEKAKRTFIYSIIIGIIMALAVAIQYWYVFCYSIDLDKVKKEKTEKVNGRTKKNKPMDRYRERNQARNFKTGGARESNEENMKKPMLIDPMLIEDNEEDDDDDDDGSGSDTGKVALAASAAALILGAASAGPSSTRNRQVSSDNNNKPQRRRPRRKREATGTTPASDDNEEAGGSGADEEKEEVTK